MINLKLYCQVSVQVIVANISLQKTIVTVNPNFRLLQPLWDQLKHMHITWQEKIGLIIESKIKAPQLPISLFSQVPMYDS